MAYRRGKSGSSDRFYFLELQNDGVFLLGRKSMINTGSVLKSRDITTNKASYRQSYAFFFFFSVVRYECENWNNKEG